MRALNGTAAALLARLQAGEQIPMVQLLEVMLTVPQRYTTAGHALAWNTYTWTPAGIAVEHVDDSTSEMPSIRLVFPGVTEAQLSLALTEDTEGKTVRIYDALLDPATGVVADAVLAWAGTMNVPAIADGPEAIVTIECEHRGVTALRPKPARYSNEAQQRINPGDTSLDIDPLTDAAPVKWPAASYWRQ